MRDYQAARQLIREDSTWGQLSRSGLNQKLKESGEATIGTHTYQKLRIEETGYRYRDIRALRTSGFTQKEINDLTRAKDIRSGQRQYHDLNSATWAKMRERRSEVRDRITSDYKKRHKAPSRGDLDREINRFIGGRTIWDFLDDISPRKRKKSVDFDRMATKTRQTKFERDYYTKRMK